MQRDVVVRPAGAVICRCPVERAGGRVGRAGAERAGNADVFGTSDAVAVAHAVTRAHDAALPPGLLRPRRRLHRRALDRRQLRRVARGLCNCPSGPRHNNRHLRRLPAKAVRRRARVARKLYSAAAQHVRAILDDLHRHQRRDGRACRWLHVRRRRRPCDQWCGSCDERRLLVALQDLCLRGKRRVYRGRQQSHSHNLLSGLGQRIGQRRRLLFVRDGHRAPRRNVRAGLLLLRHVRGPRLVRAVHRRARLRVRPGGGLRARVAALQRLEKRRGAHRPGCRRGRRLSRRHVLRGRTRAGRAVSCGKRVRGRGCCSGAVRRGYVRGLWHLHRATVFARGLRGEPLGGGLHICRFGQRELRRQPRRRGGRGRLLRIACGCRVPRFVATRRRCAAHGCGVGQVPRGAGPQRVQHGQLLCDDRVGLTQLWQPISHWSTDMDGRQG